MDAEQLSVRYMGEKTVVVSLTCSKRTDTMVKLCEVFESLKLNVITANIICLSGRLTKTVFIQVTPLSFFCRLYLYSVFKVPFIVFCFGSMKSNDFEKEYNRIE